MTEETKFPTTKKPRRTALQRQRRAVIIALCVVAVLAVAFAIVSFFTSRIVFKDLDGTKYYIRQRTVTVETTSGPTEQERWVMEDRDGNRLSQDVSNNYITALGTLVMVDASTGEYTIVAAVIPEGSETTEFDYELGRYDVLLYPEMTVEKIDSIEIYNQNGGFTFVSDGEGSLEIKGHEGLPYLNSTMLSTLVNLTGYTRTLKKIDISEAYDEKSKDYEALEGFRQNGYAEYGLPENPDDATAYFIIKGTDVMGNAVEHKVLIGNMILSEAGYYARYVGREDVYVLKQLEETDYMSTLSSTLLGKMEDYVTPMVTTPISTNNYFDMEDFTISKYDQEDKTFEEVVKFTYVPIQLRQGTFDSSLPYQTPEDGPLGGYSINSYNVDDCLQSLQSITPLRTVKLYNEYPGVDDDPDMNVYRFMEEYCGGVAAYAIGFTFHASRDATTYEAIESDSYMNQIWISGKTENNTYYMFNATFNMVVECSMEYLDFLDWGRMQWIEPEIFSGNIAFLQEVDISLKDGTHITFRLDNSESPVYDDGTIDSSKLRVTADRDGDGITDTDVDVTQFRLFYRTLLASSLEGNMPDGTEATQEALRASGDSGADLVIRMTYNKDGKALVRTYRFYSKTAGNLGAFTTLDGNGSFYMIQRQVDKIISDIGLIFTPETPIDPESKF